eukprot:g3219.t1
MFRRSTRVIDRLFDCRSAEDMEGGTKANLKERLHLIEPALQAYDSKWSIENLDTRWGTPSCAGHRRTLEGARERHGEAMTAASAGGGRCAGRTKNARPNGER